VRESRDDTFIGNIGPRFPISDLIDCADADIEKGCEFAIRPGVGPDESNFVGIKYIPAGVLILFLLSGPPTVSGSVATIIIPTLNREPWYIS